MPGRGSVSGSQQDPRGSVVMDDDDNDKKSTKRKQSSSILENMPEEAARRRSGDSKQSVQDSEKNKTKDDRSEHKKSPTHSEKSVKNSEKHSEKSSDKSSDKNSDKNTEENSEKNSEKDSDKGSDKSSHSHKSNISGHSQQESGASKKLLPAINTKSQKNSEEHTSPKTEKTEKTNKTDKTEKTVKIDRSVDSSNYSDAQDDPKQGKKKYGFRLTPEEQELAYELKAGMMRRLDDQNAKLNRELSNHNKFQGVRQKQQERAYSAKYSKDDKLSRLNAIKLMRMYEKKYKESDGKIKKLEADLEDSQDLAKRYRDMYVAEKDKSGGSSSRSTTQGESQQHKNKDKTEESEEVNEDDLDDDVALYKRHVSKLAESGKMVTTSPIRIADIIRKNEVLLLENDILKREIQRLRRDNAELVKKVKHSREERDVLLNNISTSESARIELIRRLEREQKEHKKLHKSLTLQASDWIQAKKEMQSDEDTRRWQQIPPYYGKKYTNRSNPSQSSDQKRELTPTQ